MLRKLALFLCCSILPPQIHAEETRYVSENIYVYLHSGPGSQYKIIGSVAAGRQIQLLPEEPENGYSKILDSRNREGWIQTSMIVKAPTFRVIQPRLEQQNESLRRQLEAAETGAAGASRHAAGLETRLAAQIKARQTAETGLKQAQIQLASVRRDEKYRFWREGGMIAGAGLLTGLILAYLPRPVRKRKTNW